jgi:hypothetical protein
MKVRLILAMLLPIVGCSDNDAGIAGAKDKTPVRYVICGHGESNCFVSARFKDMGGCENHKAWSEMLCDSQSTPGVMICKKDVGPAIATSHCTL